MIAAATAAFAGHYPLAVKPQHFWLMILQSVATHVEQKAEEVRDKWVYHKDKMTLNVNCDEFALGSYNDWASVVDGKPDCFSRQISKNIVEGLEKELLPDFTNTSPVENIALKVTVMDCVKSFFSFSCSTMCGFPSIEMEGTEQDWVTLRQNAEKLVNTRCTK